MRISRVAGVAACGLAGIITMAATSGAATDRSIFTFNAGMNGAREVPGPGEIDASGHARITVNTETGEVCWDLTVRNIDAPITGTHIHEGDRDEFGFVVVPLTDPVDGHASDCTIVDPATAQAIAANPSGYYVNVHSSEFPGGAVRGQLAGRHS